MPGEVLTLYRAGLFDPESEGERALLAFLGPDAADFACAVTDVAPPYRLDVYHRAARLVLEYDSERHHTAEHDIHADRRRELAVRARGIEVIRVTKGMIRDEPERTRGHIRAIVARRLGLSTLGHSG